MIVPRLLLAEIAGLARRLTRDPIRARLVVDAWRTFTHVQIVSLDDTLIDTAAEIAADYALRGADATYVAVARQYNCTLVSLDREQRERAAAIVTTRTPGDVLAELQPPPAAPLLHDAQRGRAAEVARDHALVHPARQLGKRRPRDAQEPVARARRRVPHAVESQRGVAQVHRHRTGSNAVVSPARRLASRSASW